MKTIKITVLKKVIHEDLINKYEKPQINPCPLKENDVFISKSASIPDNFCQSAWITLYPYVFSLSNNASSLFDEWMIDEKSAIVSCSDGFRPVSFLLEVID